MKLLYNSLNTLSKLDWTLHVGFINGHKIITGKRKLQMHNSLLIFAFGFPVHHFPEAGKDLALPLPPFFLVEGRQGSLFVRTVDLVFLPQTHSLHAAMSKKVHKNRSAWQLQKRVEIRRGNE